MQASIQQTTLTAVGQSAIYNPPNNQGSVGSLANPFMFILGPQYTGLQGVFEGSLDPVNFTSPFPIRAFNVANGQVVVGSIASPIVVTDAPLAASDANAFIVWPDGGISVRFRVTTLGTGSPVVNGRTVDFFPQPAPPTSSQNSLELFRQRVAQSIMMEGLGIDLSVLTATDQALLP